MQAKTHTQSSSCIHLSSVNLYLSLITAVCVWWGGLLDTSSSYAWGGIYQVDVHVVGLWEGTGEKQEASCSEPALMQASMASYLVVGTLVNCYFFYI